MPPPVLLPQSIDHSDPKGSAAVAAEPSPVSINSYTSLENLMADLTMNAPSASVPIEASDVMIVNDPESLPLFNNMPDVIR